MKNIPPLVTTAVIILTSIIIWFAFDIVKIIKTNPAPTIPTALLIPLNPSLDEANLNKLPQRVYINDSEIATIKVEPLIESSQSAIVATESAVKQ